MVDIRRNWRWWPVLASIMIACQSGPRDGGAACTQNPSLCDDGSSSTVDACAPNDTASDANGCVHNRSDGGGDDGGGGDGGGGNTGGGSSASLFPREAIWYRDISSAAADPRSDGIIRWLESAGGWGNGGVFQIDFSIEVLRAGSDTPLREFEPTEDFYEPDCDFQPVPVPDGGAIEGEYGYACASDGDCHLIVVHEPT